MGKIPTILSGGSVQTGGIAPNASFAPAEAIAASGRSISGGLSDIGRGAIQYQQNENTNNAKLEQKQAYDNHLWSEGQFTTAQRDWVDWTHDVQTNGAENVVEQFKDKFSAYQSEMLDKAPNDDARNRLKLRLDDLGTHVFEQSMHIEAANRAQNTITSFGKQIDDATDFISKDPELYAATVIDLRKSLDEAKDQKRINPQVHAKIRQEVDNLQAVAVDALVGRNPEYAKMVLDNAEGIDWPRRKALQSEIDRATQSNDTLFKYQQNELLKSHLDSLTQNGQGVASFNLDTYVSSHPKDMQPAARQQALDEIEKAKTVYVGSSQMQGQSPGEIGRTLQSFIPGKDDPKFNDKMQVYQKLQDVADQQVKLFTKDPFTYSRQDPVVDHAWKMVEQLPDDAKPAIKQQLIGQAVESAINYQKSKGIPEGRLSAMSQPAAMQIAQKINQGDAKTVQDTFAQMTQTYGKYFPTAFRDLVSLPEGQRIDAATQVVALHLGKPFLSDFIAAVRTPMSDMKIDPKDQSQIRDRLTTSSDFMSFRGAMMSANPGAASMVDEFSTAIDKYATSLYFRGKAKNPGEAVKQATDLILGSAYGFTSVNDVPVAVKRQQGGTQFNDDDVSTIGKALTDFQKTINADTVEISKFQFPDNVSPEAKSRSVADTVHKDSFWVTNPQNDGATLYMNGFNGTSAQVKTKDGQPVEMKFQELLRKGRDKKRIPNSVEEPAPGGPF